jgi:hypothetical protein
LIALLLAGCTRSGLPLMGAACPCLEGYVCCANVCVPEGTACGVEAVEPGVDPSAIRTPLIDATPEVFRVDDVARGGGATIWDFDDDGDLDVAFADVFGRRTVLFANDGAGGFDDVTGAWGGIVPPFLAMRFGDITGDGVTDFFLTIRKIAITMDKSPVWLATGRGDGGFDVAPTAIVPADVDGSIKGSALIDLDADGDLDLIGCIDEAILTRAPLFIALWDNGDLRARPDLVSAWTGTATSGCSAGNLGDFDGDLDLDYLACGTELRLYENHLDHFELVEAEGLPEGIANDCRSVEWTDFDGDGDLDIAYQTQSKIYEEVMPVSGTVIYRNDTPRDGEPSFRRVGAIEEDLTDVECPLTNVTVARPTLAGGSRSGSWIDADLDGDLDLFLPQPFPACIWNPILYENTAGDGTAFEAHSIPAYGAFTGPTGLAAGDLDGDGDLDLISNDWAYSDRTLFRNNAVEDGALDDRFWLEVGVEDGAGRTVVAAVVEMDLDGPLGAPDFVNGRDKKQIRVIAPTGREASGPPLAYFGSATGGEVCLRTRIPDGRVLMSCVDAWNQRVVLAP